MKVPTIPLLAALLFAASFAPPASGQATSGMTGPVDIMTDGAENLFVPAAVRGAGGFGSFFITDLWIRAGGTGMVTIYYHATDSPSSLPTVTIVLRISQAVTYLPDVMLANFGLEAGFGNIRISAPFPVAGSVRISNRTSAGTYGVSFTGLAGHRAMTAEPAGGSAQMDEYAMYMVGLLPDPGSRVNVNVVSTSEAGSSGLIDVVDSDGNPPAGPGPVTFPFALAGYSNHQFADILGDVHSKFAGGDASLQIRVRVGAGTAIAYAAVTENTTNDGYVVMGTVMNGGRGMGGGAAVPGPGGIRTGH